MKTESTLYAYLDLSEDMGGNSVYELFIGADYPSHPSFGAAMSKGFFNTKAAARQYASDRGVTHFAPNMLEENSTK